MMKSEGFGNIVFEKFQNNYETILRPVKTYP